MQRYFLAIKKINKVVTIVCVILFIVMFLAALAGILCRFVFDLPLGFSQELTQYLMIYIVFLATPLALSKGRLLRLEALAQHIPDQSKLERVYKWLTTLCLVGFYGLAAYSAIAVMQINYVQLSPAMDISMAIPYSAILVGGVLMVLNSIALLAKPGGDA